MIIVKNLSKIYGSKDASVIALKDINLTIEEGLLTVILGKSGSGKTTLMNMIGGLDKPNSGSVIVDDVDICKLSAKDLANYRNKKIGFVFQSFYLESSFTVLDNVCMPLMICGIGKKEREARGKEILIKLGLEEKINKKANELSGGQKQRVSLARALINNPDIILADEPTGNLDTKTGKEVMDILKDISKSGKTVILVTHNLDDAKMADKMINIEDGLAWEGSAFDENN